MAAERSRARIQRLTGLICPVPATWRTTEAAWRKKKACHCARFRQHSHNAACYFGNVGSNIIGESILARLKSEEASIPRDAYSHDYINGALLASLSEQILRVVSYRPQNILEIGIGNGFVSNFLRASGFEVTTFDINSALDPDVVGDVCELDKHFKEKQFDVVLCAEVLEHMPFLESQIAIQKLAYVCRRRCLITLPERQYRIVDIQGRVFFRLRRKFEFDINLFRSKPSGDISTAHHWEINHTSKTSMKAIKELFSTNFELREVSRSRLCAYQYFFVLDRKS